MTEIVYNIEIYERLENFDVYNKGSQERKLNKCMTRLFSCILLPQLDNECSMLPSTTAEFGNLVATDCRNSRVSL